MYAVVVALTQQVVVLSTAREGQNPVTRLTRETLVFLENLVGPRRSWSGHQRLQPVTVKAAPVNRDA